MLQFKNATPFSGTILAAANPEGIDSVYTIVRGTFTLAGALSISEEQLPLAIQDQFRDDPIQSSIQQPSDVGLVKPGTDVLLHGSAHALGGPVTAMDVALRLGTVDKRIRVTGDRVWNGSKPTSPEAFESMPLVWERAFGGIDQSKDDPAVLEAEAANPVGCGFWMPGGVMQTEGMALPNLEDPQQPISEVKDRPVPAGLAAVCPHWEPRRSFAGTYDEAWQKGRAPYLPTDFDSRFFQLAPADQIIEDYLKGNEPVHLSGVAPGGELDFCLPGIGIHVTYMLDDAEHTPAMNLDTVLIEPDEHRVTLVWRAVLTCDKKTLRVREVHVSAFELN